MVFAWAGWGIYDETRGVIHAWLDNLLTIVNISLEDGIHEHHSNGAVMQ